MTVIYCVDRSSSLCWWSSIAKLRLKGTVLLNFVDLLLGLSLISLLLYLRFWFSKAIPALLPRLLLILLAAWINFRLESTLFRELFLCISDKFNWLLSLRILYWCFTDFSCNCGFQKGGISHSSGWLSWFRNTLLLFHCWFRYRRLRGIHVLVRCFIIEEAWICKALHVRHLGAFLCLSLCVSIW